MVNATSGRAVVTRPHLCGERIGFWVSSFRPWTGCIQRDCDPLNLPGLYYRGRGSTSLDGFIDRGPVANQITIHIPTLRYPGEFWVKGRFMVDYHLHRTRMAKASEWANISLTGVRAFSCPSTNRDVKPMNSRPLIGHGETEDRLASKTPRIKSSRKTTFRSLFRRLRTQPTPPEMIGQKSNQILKRTNFQLLANHSC
jgi:hypothetical protein